MEFQNAWNLTVHSLISTVDDPNSLIFEGALEQLVCYYFLDIPNWIVSPNQCVKATKMSEML